MKIYKIFKLSIIGIFFIIQNNVYTYALDLALTTAKIVETYNTQKSGSREIHIYIIEDLHCNKECQIKIKKILESIKQAYKTMGIIGVEGSTGKIDVSVLRKLNKRKRKKVIKKLLNKGYITGEEMFGVDVDVEIIGIEDKDLYMKNFERLCQGSKDNDVMNEEIDAVLLKIKLIKEVVSIYNTKFARLEQLKKQYNQGKLTLQEYIRLLFLVNYDVQKNKDKIMEYKIIRNYIKAMELYSRVKEEKARIEYKFLLKDIEESLTNEEKKILEMQKNKYANLDNILKSKRISYEKKYKELALFLEYFRIKETIDHAKLIQEVRKLEKDITKVVVVSKDVKDLIYLNRHLELFKAYVNNNISREEVEEFELGKEHYQEIMQDLGKRIAADDHVIEREDLNKIYGYMKDFYELAYLRDEAMVNNMLAQIKSNKTESLGSNIMIIGGFHTKGITKILRNKGLAYSVIRPTILKEATKDLYKQRVQEQAEYYGYE